MGRWDDSAAPSRDWLSAGHEKGAIAPTPAAAIAIATITANRVFILTILNV